MTILWSNNASTTVSGSITPASTTVQLAAGTGVMFPNPTSGNYYVATFYDQATKTQNEIVHVTAMAGDVATIVRAQEGTTAKTWGPGDIFANLVTAGTLAAFVQAGTGPANTSNVYVGTDTSTTVNLVVANTNPVPASLAVGMLFNILINNTNTGNVNVQLNGGTSIPLVRSNGAGLLSGDITKSMETTFVYNGVNFNTMLPNIVKPITQTTFYVNPSGNDNNDGTANTPANAFATVQGAINAIKSRYTSQQTITIRVADGHYIGGFTDNTSYIAAWSIIGDASNPGACIIDASGSGGPAGIPFAVWTANATIMSVNGFALLSAEANIVAAGTSNLTVYNCNLTGDPANMSAVYATDHSNVYMYGNFQYSSSYSVGAILEAGGGNINLGTHSASATNYCTITISGNPPVSSGTAIAGSGGVVDLDPVATSFAGGTPSGHAYQAFNSGGIFANGQLNRFPGSLPGVVTSPGWAG